MGNFNKGGKFGGDRGGSKFGGKRDSGKRSFGNDRGDRPRFGGNRERPDMHKAICSDCGNGCEVPFRPTGDKPIYCSDCFKNHSSGTSRDTRGGRNEFGARDNRPRFEEKRSYANDAGKSSEQYRAQFDAINAKLDKLIKLLTPVAPTEATAIVAPTSTKFEKPPKKTVDTADLRKTVVKAMDKKTKAKTPTPKKEAPKKSVAKKVAAKKVTVAKKPTKKAPAKKK